MLGHTDSGKEFNRALYDAFCTKGEKYFAHGETIVPITPWRLYFYMKGLEKNPNLNVNFDITIDSPLTELCEKFRNAIKL